MSGLIFDQKSGQMVAAPSAATRRKRHYSAGESASFLGWDVQTVSADAAIYSNLNKVKARCRDLARNNDYVKNAVNHIISNVVGPVGFRLQCKLRTGKETDKAFNRKLEKLWVRAGKLKNSPTVCGKLSRTDKARLWWRTLLVDGEVIEVRHPGFRGNGFGYATQFVDTARLDWQKNEKLANGNEIRMGVEITSLGKPVAYWFLNNDPSETFWGYSRSSQEHTRIEAEYVRHTFIMEGVGQTRGVPMIASPAVRAHMLQRFEEAAVVAARVSASKIGFFKPNEEFQGQAPGEEDEDYTVHNSYEPGSFDMLPRGVDVEKFDPDAPPAGFNEFCKNMLRGVAAGIMGANYITMTGDLEAVNYSSIRAGQVEERPMFKALQNFYIEHVLEPELEDWLALQVFNPMAQLALGKVQRVLAEECYKFLGRGWQWVDPLKEVKAYGEAIELRLTSPRRIVAETLGEDYDDLLEEIAEDEKALEAHGLVKMEERS